MAASAPAATECPVRYDREEELSRDFVAFDQTDGTGWRPLYDSKCFIEAAELLRDWRAANGDDLDPNDPRGRSFMRTLIWHEAQMWAFGGRNDLALPLFERTRDGDEAAQAWNLYVEGTLAFLDRDRAGLKRATERLMIIPEPPGWGSAVGADGSPISMPWPQNLDVLEGLARCWDDTYAVAYLCRDVPGR